MFFFPFVLYFYICSGKAALLFAIFYWLSLNQAEQGERSRRDLPPHSLGAAAFNRPPQWFIISACLGAARGWGELFLTNCRGARGLAKPLCQVGGVAPPEQWQHCQARSSLQEGERGDFVAIYACGYHIWGSASHTAITHCCRKSQASFRSPIFACPRWNPVRMRSQECANSVPGSASQPCISAEMLRDKQPCSESRPITNIFQVHRCSPLKKSPISFLKTWKSKTLNCVFQRSS